MKKIEAMIQAELLSQYLPITDCKLKISLDELSNDEQAEIITYLCEFGKWIIFDASNDCRHYLIETKIYSWNAGAISMNTGTKKRLSSLERNAYEYGIQQNRKRYLVGENWTRDNLKQLQYALSKMPMTDDFIDSVKGL